MKVSKKIIIAISLISILNVGCSSKENDYNLSIVNFRN